MRALVQVKTRRKNNEKLKEVFRAIHNSLEVSPIFETMYMIGKSIEDLNNSSLFKAIEAIENNMKPVIGVTKEALDLELVNAPVLPPKNSYTREYNETSPIYTKESTTHLKSVNANAIVYDQESKTLKWKGEIILRLMEGKIPFILMELAFVKGYGYKIPTTAFREMQYTHYAIKEGINNFAKSVMKKAKQHGIPLSYFGGFVARKPSNYIILSDFFAAR